MTCLLECKEHQRDRPSNVFVEIADVVRRCRELPRHPVRAKESAEVDDTLHEAPGVRAKYADICSGECDSSQDEQRKAVHRPQRLTTQNIAGLDARRENAVGLRYRLITPPSKRLRCRIIEIKKVIQGEIASEGYRAQLD